MTPDEAIDRAFLDAIGALARQPPQPQEQPVRAGSSLTGRRCLEIFGAQLASRHLDLAARVLRSQAKGFYTIGSAGHESNAFVAGVLRPTDPALLHYRSGAFFACRGVTGCGRGQRIHEDHGHERTSGAPVLHGEPAQPRWRPR